MITHTTTGKFRYRTERRLLRDPLLVLQVEIHITGTDTDGYGGSHNVDYIEWRDAKVSDLLHFNGATTGMVPA